MCAYSPTLARRLSMRRWIRARYAFVRADVERRGRSKSDFDLMIACTALEHEATLSRTTRR
jgi:predicted nucleic acid-binding protein